MSDDVLTYLEEETNETILLRLEFLSELVLAVLQAVSEPSTWRDVAVNAVFIYQSNRQRFIDGDVSGILTKSTKGDWWVRREYITNAKRRAAIRDILAAQGYYIANIVGKGIYLSDNKKDIRADHARNIKMVRSRADRMSFRASQINKVTDYELPLVTTKAVLEDGLS